MAVPAVYKKLILYYEAASARDQTAMRRAAAQLRLYVCGSASLSKADFDAWRHISGHDILERYGMTETGMTLSNPYDNRRQGLLGTPLPGVQVAVENDHSTGQLLVKGPGVFPHYMDMPEKTEQAFTPDGWFKTGDVVTTDPDTGYYKLLGRESADIIKTGGYKVSALEIEDVIRECDGVVDCCVIGVPDDVLGERIAAALIVDHTSDVLQRVQRRVEQFLPKYKIPRQYHVVDDFPRNVLGKVQKQMLRLRLGVSV
ncbi:acid-thiol ligase [Gracilaria domingensis]|nr:acid-thiol ligase [Gracilaria domingensis]